MKLGMVGLPNVGKSTLFNALTNAGAASANYPFCTIEPNVGIVSVPDSRLDYLREMYHPAKFTPASLEFVDIAGLVKGASKGEGLGNKFLADIRETDAIVHVVRCFDNTDIIHVDGNINPGRDIETINLELIFADIEMLERRIDRVKKLLKGDKKAAGELETLEALKSHLEEGKTARSFGSLDADFYKTTPLLSAKPVIYAANMSDDEIGKFSDNDYYNAVKLIAEAENAVILPICAEIEAEISGMDPEDKMLFLDELNMENTGLERIIKIGYETLGQISYLTAGEDECRAWTITNGTKAPQAAGKIHTDFERGFIRAEVVAFEDLKNCGSIASAREKGLLRLEGKDYVVKDGDVVHFRFNV
ncbi:MAG: redox-regulated ATPase YchF [Ruminococcus sp.]|jgi:GTP-binding protein YchF|nr:redox-regulated ATPase YchF [Ruminococcus sp.]